MKQSKSKLDELVKVVKQLQERMEIHNSKLHKNEELTRYVLIDPLLRVLGWDTENPNSVCVQYRLKERTKEGPDYALFCKDRIIAFIEAKSYGTFPVKNELEESKEIDQLIRYCNRKAVPLGIFTDGGGWLVFKVFKEATLKERIVNEIDFGWEDGSRIARSAFKLAPSRMESLL